MDRKTTNAHLCACGDGPHLEYPGRNVWLLGRLLSEKERAETPALSSWVVEGIFTSRGRAASVPRVEAGPWFVAALPLDEQYARGRVETMPDFEWLT